MILIEYLAFTILEHLQSFLHLRLIISQLTQMMASLQVPQDLSTTYNSSVSSSNIRNSSAGHLLRAPVAGLLQSHDGRA